MRYSGFKKVHEDGDKAILKHKNGSELKIAKATLSPKHLQDLKALPLYQAEGTYIPEEDKPEPQATQPPQAPVNIFVGGQQPQPAPQPQPTPAPTPAPMPQAVTPPPTPQPSAPMHQPTQAEKPKTIAPQPVQQQPVEEQQAQAPEEQPMVEEPEREIAAQPRVPATPEEKKALQLQEYVGGDQAFTNDLNNGHITPKTYSDLFASKSTLGKVGTLFGLLVSGAGSGLAKQPNAVLEMMNQEIKRDLEAQMKSKDNAINYLKLNQAQQLQKSQVGLIGAQAKLTQTEAAQKAFALSQMQMNRAAFHNLVSQNQKLPVGSPARKAGDQMLAMMYQAINNENFSIADRAAAAGALSSMVSTSGGQEGGFQSGNTALRMSGNTPLAEDRESKHFPGVSGQASVPLNGADRQKIDTGIRFDRQLNEFIDWTQKHSGSLSPTEYKTGVAKAAELQAAYRAATNGGVYKEGEQNFISKIIDSRPTKFFNSIRVVPQLKAVAHENKLRVDQTAKNLGFNGYSGFQSKQSKQPQGGNQPQYKTVNGVKYMRGPKGEAIPVKE